MGKTAVIKGPAEFANHSVLSKLAVLLSIDEFKSPKIREPQFFNKKKKLTLVIKRFCALSEQLVKLLHYINI